MSERTQTTGQSLVRDQVDKVFSEMNSTRTRLHLTVPGSTTNLGPGFDALGLALSIYSRFVFEILPTDDKSIPLITVTGKAQGELSTGKDNVLYQIMRDAWRAPAELLNRVRIQIDTDIPLARGLGSSSTAVLSALWAARALSGAEPDRDYILTEASRIEGHPDNVGACFLGGCIVAAPSRDHRRALAQRLDWPQEWHTLVVVPPYPLSTELARKALPKSIKLADATANVQRATLLVASIVNRDADALREALDDRLHEPYRISLVQELKELRALLRHTAALGCVLSGAGSSVLIIVHSKDKQDVLSRIESWAKSRANRPDILDLSVDNEGLKAKYEKVG